MIGKWAGALAAAAFALGGVALASSTPPPPTLVLKLSDLPTGFGVEREGTGWRSNARAAKEGSISKATLDRWGRINGYEATFSRELSLKSALTGSASVDSFASAYRTTGGAHSSYADNVRRCNRKPFRTLSLAEKVGDEAVLCVAQFKNNGETYLTYAVIWRRGTIYAAIITAGLDGATDPEEAVAIALKQDGRIRSALG